MDIKTTYRQGVNEDIFKRYADIERLIDGAPVDELFNHPWHLIISEVLALDKYRDKYEQYRQLLQQKMED